MSVASLQRSRFLQWPWTTLEVELLKLLKGFIWGGSSCGFRELRGPTCICLSLQKGQLGKEVPSQMHFILSKDSHDFKFFFKATILWALHHFILFWLLSFILADWKSQLFHPGTCSHFLPPGCEETWHCWWEHPSGLGSPSNHYMAAGDLSAIFKIS